MSDSTVFTQKLIQLKSQSRGCHLITHELISVLDAELGTYQAGLAHFHLLHTSAALTLNENAAPAVRRDMQRWLDHAIPDGWEQWTHTDEGPDDMPAHVKASLFGVDLLIPIHAGNLVLGQWQGIYLCEQRDYAGNRSVFITLWGERKRS